MSEIQDNLDQQKGSRKREPIVVPPIDNLLYETNPPEMISDELRPILEELGLVEVCHKLATDGWAVIEDAASPEFNERLRNAIIDSVDGLEAVAATPAKAAGKNMNLREDPVFAEAALNPKILAVAEFSVGRGFLFSQMTTSVKCEGAKGIALHADNNWLPAPFPDHNFLTTFCWACDDFTKENGATLVIPGTKDLRRHPDEKEMENLEGAVPIECSAGSIALWDGNVWHAAYDRDAPGERVVAHMTYSRLAMRPVEDYSNEAEMLIARHGGRMAQLLGKEDSLYESEGFGYSQMIPTFNNAKR